MFDSWDSIYCNIATRLLCPWDSPGKNPGVGCHFLLHSSVNSPTTDIIFLDLAILTGM